MKTIKDLCKEKRKKNNMKEIIYNYDNLEEKEINKIVERAKIIITNSKNEIMLANSNQNYFLIGGHVEENESLKECLIRETKEETGISLQLKEEIKPYLVIKYLCKDYPNKGENTKYITNYFALESNLSPDLTKITLTTAEKEGNFHFEYLKKEDILRVLHESLATCTKQIVVRDTIDAIEEYLKIEK